MAMTKNQPMAVEERRYRAEDALRTLERAQEIRDDASLMKEVERCRQEKMRALASIKVETSKPRKT